MVVYLIASMIKSHKLSEQHDPGQIHKILVGPETPVSMYSVGRQLQLNLIYPSWNGLFAERHNS